MWHKLGQTKKFISFSGQFPKIFMRPGGTFFCCNNQCWFKCSGSLYQKQQWSRSSNLRIGLEWIRKWPETDSIFFSQCKNNQCDNKNTRAAVPEKLTINFFWPYLVVFFLHFYLSSKIAMTGYFLLYTVTDWNVAFLVTLSHVTCWALGN
jgi:hypothetical protein